MAYRRNQTASSSFQTCLSKQSEKHDLIVCSAWLYGKLPRAYLLLVENLIVAMQQNLKTLNNSRLYEDDRGPWLHQSYVVEWWWPNCGMWPGEFCRNQVMKDNRTIGKTELTLFIDIFNSIFPFMPPNSVLYQMRDFNES